MDTESHSYSGISRRRPNERWIRLRRYERTNKIVGKEFQKPEIMAEPPHNPEPLLAEDIFTLTNVPPEERRTGTPSFYRPPRQQRKTA